MRVRAGAVEVWEADTAPCWDAEAQKSAGEGEAPKDRRWQPVSPDREPDVRKKRWG